MCILSALGGVIGRTGHLSAGPLAIISLSLAGWHCPVVSVSLINHLRVEKAAFECHFELFTALHI